jgi:FixJ family two-component response regulator
MDGEETYQALRRIRDDVPVIMMSGYGERELAARYTEGGVAGFIQKPFLMRTLSEVLWNALEGEGDGHASG